MQLDLLWENAAPTSAFAAQKITLDLTKYDMVSVVVNCGEVFTALKGSTSNEITMLTTFYYGRWRVFRIYDDGIEFKEGRYVTSGWGEGSTANNQVVPIRIYGIKL